MAFLVAPGGIGNGASSKVTEGWQEARSGRRGRRSHRTRGGGARRAGLAAALGRRDRRHSRCLVNLWSAAARLNERLQGEARAARPRPDVMVSRQARLEHRPARSICSQPLLPNVSYPRRQPGAEAPPSPQPRASDEPRARVQQPPGPRAPTARPRRPQVGALLFWRRCLHGPPRRQWKIRQVRPLARRCCSSAVLLARASTTPTSRCRRARAALAGASPPPSATISNLNCRGARRRRPPSRPRAPLVTRAPAAPAPRLGVTRWACACAHM